METFSCKYSSYVLYITNIELNSEIRLKSVSDRYRTVGVVDKQFDWDR
jgi:hypothetical protein